MVTCANQRANLRLCLPKRRTVPCLQSGRDSVSNEKSWLGAGRQEPVKSREVEDQIRESIGKSVDGYSVRGSFRLIPVTLSKMSSVEIIV